MITSTRTCVCVCVCVQPATFISPLTRRRYDSTGLIKSPFYHKHNERIIPGDEKLGATKRWHLFSLFKTLSVGALSFFIREQRGEELEERRRLKRWINKKTWQENRRDWRMEGRNEENTVQPKTVCFKAFNMLTHTYTRALTAL